MRKVILDTETTGLDCRAGDRVVEIGCVELVGRQLTGQRFHVYLNPERPVGESERIHGLSDEFLADQAKFADVAEDFIAFIRDAELVIHNARFDVGFLDNELALAGLDPLAGTCGKVIDTLGMARDMRPGKKNNLDALCNEFGVDNSGRQLHGALLDAELLAEVYLAMTRGQESMDILFDSPGRAEVVRQARQRPPLLVLRATAEELAGHAAVLAEIGQESRGSCLWAALDAAPGSP